ncbi:hypothetical protein H5407_17875 [Mitsuaria sp. WAJ17]|uniref:hypothetical protein n=1 Tax=Mitsuaria sp. WAJ17 TaxID=2761452 RepID=UPI00160435EB|nr:hypothetical protein [Mitsuaria sp. WAJ17]MBB2487103.1 hypothetical protein [Mitsuaria sp. WAJ17]
MSFELISLCMMLNQTMIAQEVSRFNLPATLKAKLNHRQQACSQSSGIDWDQMRALTAAKMRSFASADEFLIHQALKGGMDELDTFYRLGDVQGMAGWGLMAVDEKTAWFTAGEPLLLIHAQGATGVAWQAAVCQRFTCDDFNARLVHCRDEQSCQMSLQDILKESSGVDDATWQQLLAAARRRLDALLPG